MWVRYAKECELGGRGVNPCEETFSGLHADLFRVIVMRIGMTGRHMRGSPQQCPPTYPFSSQEPPNATELSSHSKTTKPLDVSSRGFAKWRIPDLNRWPLACHASALPAELIPRRCAHTVWFGLHQIDRLSGTQR